MILKNGHYFKNQDFDKRGRLSKISVCSGLGFCFRLGELLKLDWMEFCEKYYGIWLLFSPFSVTGFCLLHVLSDISWWLFWLGWHWQFCLEDILVNEFYELDYGWNCGWIEIVFFFFSWSSFFFLLYLLEMTGQDGRWCLSWKGVGDVWSLLAFSLGTVGFCSSTALVCVSVGISVIATLILLSLQEVKWLCRC